MRQTLMVVTCDKCGKQESFETLLVHSNGPIVSTRHPPKMLERRGWTCLENGLRQIDICDKCKDIPD